MSDSVRPIYGTWILEDGTQLNFPFSTSTSNGWWQYQGGSIGRGADGRTQAQNRVHRALFRKLEQHNWPIPAKVERKNEGVYGHGSFALQFPTVFGPVALAVDLRNKEIKFTSQPGMEWIDHKIDQDSWDYKSLRPVVHTAAMEGSLENYIANPLKTIAENFPGYLKYLPHGTGIAWMELLSTPGQGEINGIKYNVTPTDVVYLKGGYAKIANGKLKLLEELFDAFKAAGIQVSVRTGGDYWRGRNDPNANATLEEINITFPKAEVPRGYLSDLEYHAEPHSFNISMHGVYVDCGYVKAEQKMENYQKLKAAQELSSLLGMFDESGSTEHTVEEYDFSNKEEK